MAIYVVGYDLHPKQGETYDELIKAIEKVGTSPAWHCLDSTWLVVTTKTALEVHNELWKHMRADDQLLVVQYAPPGSAWAGFGTACTDWLKKNM